jgi:hypothetical protein
MVITLAVSCLVIGTGGIFLSETGAKGKTYAIGDKGPGGGWIFYDKGNRSGGWRYLEAAPKGLGQAKWGCEKKTITGAGKTAIGTGRANSRAILKNCSEAKIAARVAVSYRGGGYKDWFLPSKDELNMVYRNVHIYRRGSHYIKRYAEVRYWTSSESRANTAWCQIYNTGYQFSYEKNKTDTDVLPIRAF